MTNACPDDFPNILQFLETRKPSNPTNYSGLGVFRYCSEPASPSTVQYNKIQYSTAIEQYDARQQSNTINRPALAQHNTIQYSTVQCRTVQYGTVTVQCNTIQYTTIQYTTVQYSTVQYNTDEIIRNSNHDNCYLIRNNG